MLIEQIKYMQHFEFFHFIYINLNTFPMVNIDDNPLYYATIGGIILGIATSINYMLRGSVTGMSGMLYTTVTLDKKEMPINISIIGGMFISGGIFFDIFQYGTSNNFTPFGPESDITIRTSQLGFALAGILVGFGTKLGNGCTSGHGLCGLSRFSIRSFVAVLTFLTTGIVIATIIYYAGGLGPFTESRYSPIMDYDHMITANISIGIGVILPLIGLYFRITNSKQSIIQSEPKSSDKLVINQKNKKDFNTTEYVIKDQIIVFLVGLLFGFGLLVAGMVRRSNIITFLALGKDWNPSLMFVLGAGVTVNLILFTYMIKVKKQPFFGQKLFNPQNKIIDWKLVLGAVCFGLGWGIGGLCPGPAIMQAPIFTIDVHLIWVPFFFLGQFMGQKLSELYPSQNPTAQKLTSQQKSTANQIMQTSQIVKKQQNSALNYGNKGKAAKKEQVIAQILHEHGEGYTHAHKLQSLSRETKTESYARAQSVQRSIKRNLEQELVPETSY